MGRKPLLLFVIAAILAAAALSLFIVRQVGAGDHVVAGYDEVLSRPSTRAAYRSINNWQTIEETEFEGVVLSTFLEDVGVDDDGAQVKLIAPDGYFWPAVGTVLTLSDLKQANEKGLYPMLAWEMNGEALQPEPEGSGPLRLVMPQYGEEHVNKPSWVSNLRLIEIGPVEEGSAAFDATEVPVDEIWVYGDIPAVYPFSILLPLLLLGAGIVVLAAAIVSLVGGGKGSRKRPKALMQIVLVAVAVSVLVPALSLCVRDGGSCRADPGGRIFSKGELASMPSFSGHYTFLKSQEPFTYYEADYKGVPLSYLIEEKMSLAPGATGVQVKARDGYTVSLTLNQVRTVYSGGMKVIIAYEKAGTPLGADEGSLRLIVPQSVPGPKDQGGDANTPLCARMIYAVEVLPLPAGEQPPAPGAVPEGSLAVYGAVSEPAPAPQPQPQPAPSEELPQAEETAPEQKPGEIGEDTAAEAPQAILSGPEGAFCVSWLAVSSLRLQPLKAVLPLLGYLYSVMEER